MSRFGHRPLGRIAAMFNEACLNKVFGDPEGDERNKRNIPVIVQQDKTPAISSAKIEAAIGVFDPTKVFSDQLTILMIEEGSLVGIKFGGAHFDAAQFAIIAQELSGKTDILVTNEEEFEIQITDPDVEKMTIVAQAWKAGITPSLRNLGYEI
ncbi:MAG: hypothetical protein L6Q57_00260 [Alphaproteobacteria bacterium]|nr:hypothetical protein [Alphaproteobacteria bacterium]